MNITQFWLKIMGISGVLGALILFAGDMLFYYDPNSTNLIQNMGNASNNRITLSGIAALFASWLYMLGLGQVYYAFKPVKATLRNTVIVCFGGVLIAYGVVHSAYLAIAIAAKLSIQHNLDIRAATLLASEINQTLRLFVYPFFAILSFLFISLVWKRKHYTLDGFFFSSHLFHFYLKI